MQNPLSHSLSFYKMLVKRWTWVIALGVVICGGVTYIVSMLIPPVYQASAFIYLNLGSSNTSVYDNVNASLAALPTYAQLITNPAVLTPVTQKHPGLTLTQLTSMISVKPQTSTQLIELDVTSSNPQEAMQLANDVSQYFAQYVDIQFASGVKVIPALLPTQPVRPRPLRDTGIGALVGLGLALSLIFLFEWIDDRLASPEEVQEITGLDTLAVIPELSRKERNKNVAQIPTLAEGCHILCASLIAAQAIKPFKLVMITSALASEGKSTIAANVASFLAMADKRVLLVDADLRYPVLDRHFQLDNQKGLSSALLEMKAQIEPGLDGQPTDIPTLRVLTAGALLSNPAELLESPLAQQLFNRFEQASQFDYVIFDTPPLLPVADAQILASYIPATVLVIDASKTPRKFLLRAKRALNRTRTTVIGVVLNKSRWPESGDIRHYLSGLRQLGTDTRLTVPPHTPQGNSSNITIPNTLPENGARDPDITITVPRAQNARGERS
jgi:capsular exopolysaccharide synthesis family protein